MNVNIWVFCHSSLWSCLCGTSYSLCLPAFTITWTCVSYNDRHELPFQTRVLNSMGGKHIISYHLTVQLVFSHPWQVGTVNSRTPQVEMYRCRFCSRNKLMIMMLRSGGLYALTKNTQNLGIEFTGVSPQGSSHNWGKPFILMGQRYRQIVVNMSCPFCYSLCSPGGSGQRKR